MNASARADGASHHCRSSTSSTSGDRRRCSTPASTGRAATRSRRRCADGTARPLGGHRHRRRRQHFAGQRRGARQPALALARRRPRAPGARTAGARPRRGTPARARSHARSERADRAPTPAHVPPRAAATSRCPPRPRSREPRRPAAHSAHRSADALELVLALEQRDPARRAASMRRDRMRRGGGAMFGGRCQGVCPMWGVAFERTMASTPTTQRRRPRPPVRQHRCRHRRPRAGAVSVPRAQPLDRRRPRPHDDQGFLRRGPGRRHAHASRLPSIPTSRRSCSARTGPPTPVSTPARPRGVPDRHDRLPRRRPRHRTRRPGVHRSKATWTCTASSASTAASAPATSRSRSASRPPATSTTTSSPSLPACPPATRPSRDIG